MWNAEEIFTMYQNSTNSKREWKELDMKKLMQRSLKSHCYQINLSNVHSIAKKWMKEGYIIQMWHKNTWRQKSPPKFCGFPRSYKSVCNSPVRFHRGDSISSHQDRLLLFYGFYGHEHLRWHTVLQHSFFWCLKIC